MLKILCPPHSPIEKKWYIADNIQHNPSWEYNTQNWSAIYRNGYIYINAWLLLVVQMRHNWSVGYLEHITQVKNHWLRKIPEISYIR